MSTYLIVTALVALFLVDHPGTKEKHEQSMACVPKHDGEEKGEGDDGVQSCTTTEKQGIVYTNTHFINAVKQQKNKPLFRPKHTSSQLHNNRKTSHCLDQNTLHHSCTTTEKQGIVYTKTHFIRAAQQKNKALTNTHFRPTHTSSELHNNRKTRHCLHQNTLHQSCTTTEKQGTAYTKTHFIRVAQQQKNKALLTPKHTSSELQNNRKTRHCLHQNTLHQCCKTTEKQGTV